MKLLRRTTPVALSVGAAIGILFASFQVVDGVFSNPGLAVSPGSMLFYIARGYFLYLISFLVLLFLINIGLCIIFPRRMRDADYARLVESYVGLTAFVIILIIYVDKDRDTISSIIGSGYGFFSTIFFVAEIFVVIGFISLIIAGAVRQLVARLPKGRLAIYVTSIAWFLLLFPIIGEALLLAFAMKWHPILQVVLLIITAFMLSFIVKLLNNLTHSLIKLKRRAWVGLISFLVICFILWGTVTALKPKPSTHPRSGDEVNIVLISIDALRADHLGCYGYIPPDPKIAPGEFSPNIDRLAEQGLLFERAYSTSSWTLAGISSWMTGGWPYESGGTNANRRLYNGITHLPQALSEEGYVCAAFTANPVLNTASGIGRGFSKYWEYFESTHQATGLLIDRVASEIKRKLEEKLIREPGRVLVKNQLAETFNWLDDHQDDKFFLWVHLWDPHHPYTPPSPYKDNLPDIGGEKRTPYYSLFPQWRTGASHHRYGLRRHMVNLYDGEVRFSDEVTGRILDRLDELGLAEDTLVIIVSDHGEEFFEHGRMEHGGTMYQEVLHVPLIVRLPGRIPAGERIGESISLIDLYPTILDFGRTSVEPPMYRGESLKEVMLKGDMSFAGHGQMNFAPIGAGDGLDPDEISPDFGPNFEDLIAGGLSEMPEGRVIFTEDMYHFDKDLKSITMGKWKLIHSPNRFHAPSFPRHRAIVPREGEYATGDFIEGDELYNLDDDPCELKNIVYDHPDIARYLYLRLMIIDDYNKMAATFRRSKSGKGTDFGAGLKGLTKGYGYW